MSFFKETLKARLYQNKTKYPLLKLDGLLDWQLIGDKLRRARTHSRSDRRGNSGYDPLFYEGFVIRDLIQVDQTVYVYTYGEGAGILPGINEQLAPEFWRNVNGFVFRAGSD